MAALNSANNNKYHLQTRRETLIFENARRPLVYQRRFGAMRVVTKPGDVINNICNHFVVNGNKAYNSNKWLALHIS